MTDPQRYLKDLLEKKRQTGIEIANLKNEVQSKTEFYFKLEGAIEALQSVGITLDESSDSLTE